MAGAEETGGLSRRKFVTGMLAVLGGTITAVIGLPAVGYLVAPALKRSPTDVWVPLGPVESIPIDQPTLFTFSRAERIGWETTATSYGMYVLRSPDERYRVLSNVCTHLACRVVWKDDPQDYTCPCHDGHFAKDGHVLSGPPPRPLQAVEHKVEEGILYVHLVEA
ncbi:MAG: ubiquinol-cytochrome c reductase iron-sulfur subunit [Anaerolineales bacterium]|nr:ubiquinol-cytochrome c reductase iron-sulfur subunit [Anaerolineales bacterium]